MNTQQLEFIAAYRTPDKEWNEQTTRTIFAIPDAHQTFIVVKTFNGGKIFTFKIWTGVTVDNTVSRWRTTTERLTDRKAVMTQAESAFETIQRFAPALRTIVGIVTSKRSGLDQDVVESSGHQDE